MACGPGIRPDVVVPATLQQVCTRRKDSGRARMATMATMATPKLKLKKMKRGVGEDDKQPTATQKIFFRGWSAGVAMVAMVATDQKSPRASC